MHPAPTDLCLTMRIVEAFQIPTTQGKAGSSGPKVRGGKQGGAGLPNDPIWHHLKGIGAF